MPSRYRRSHPHRIRNLVLDLLLLATVFAGIRLVAHRVLNTVTLENSRIVAMEPAEFIAFVKKHEDPVYWLGPLPGSRYSFNQNAQDVDVVSYLPKGSYLSDVNQRKMTIKTYENLVAYETHIHPLMGAYTNEFVTAKGNTVVINELLDVETVTLSGRPEIVVIRYPTMQTEETLIENGNNLKLIR